MILLPPDLKETLNGDSGNTEWKGERAFPHIWAAGDRKRLLAAITREEGSS